MFVCIFLFFRDSQSNVPVDTLINRDTLCPHNGFICNVDTMEYDQSNGSVAPYVHDIYT